MKLNIDARVKDALDSGVPFETQRAAALASGRRFGIASLSDGRQAVYYADTPEDMKAIAEAQAGTREKRARDLGAELDAALARIAALESR